MAVAGPAHGGQRDCRWSILKGGTTVGGRGRIWEQVSQLNAKGCRAVGGPEAGRIFQKGRRPWVMWW